jgi:hypothetical protein
MWRLERSVCRTRRTGLIGEVSIPYRIFAWLGLGREPVFSDQVVLRVRHRVGSTEIVLRPRKGGALADPSC